jgi:hypothetical protein
MWALDSLTTLLKLEKRVALVLLVLREAVYQDSLVLVPVRMESQQEL